MAKTDPTWDVHKDALRYASKAELALSLAPAEPETAVHAATVLALLALERRLHWLGLQAERGEWFIPSQHETGPFVPDESSQ